MSTQLMDRGSITSLRPRGNKTYPNNRNQIQDNDTNDTIKLQLKKPKKWNWELSTSKSSPNIAFPRIMLYNEKGKLLADAHEADCVFSGNATECRRTQSAKTTRASTNSSLETGEKGSRNTGATLSPSSSRSKKRRSSTTNLPELNECLNNLVGQLESNGINYKLRHIAGSGIERGGGSGRKLKRQISTPVLYSPSEDENEHFWKNDKVKGSWKEVNDVPTEPGVITVDNESERHERSVNNIPEIPILVYSEKGMLQRDLNSKEFNHLRKGYTKSKTTNLDNIQITEETPSPRNIQSKAAGKSLLKSNKSLTPIKEVRFDLQKSKSAVDICDVGREKKFCRRTNSSGPSKFSGSILERMSAFKRRSSSTDSQDIEISVVEHGPRYFLRTSNAGTLVVCEESFRNRKVRRRPRSCPRVPEVDETTSQMQSTPPIGQERVLQKFTYPSTTQIYQSNDNLNRYDEAIARIDKLISNVSLKRDPAFEGDNDKFGQKVGKYRSVGDVRMKDETISSGSRVGSAPSVNLRGMGARSSSNFLTVDDPINREKEVDSEVKGKRRRRKLRRCVSANTVLQDLSSDEEDMQTDRRKFRSRSKSRTRSRDELRRKTVQLGGLSETVDNGDQILTLNNNNLSAVQSIGSSADIIDEPSDEVLLRLVQRLTSIKQSQKDISSNPSEALAPVEDISTASVKEDENQNYKTECINIADCEDYHSNNNHPLHRQTTLLSHELLLADKSRDAEEDNSEDEFSDASNEFISYTIEPLNELNGYESLSSKEPSPGSVVTNNFKESNSFPISDEDSFAATNEQQETIEEQLLAESNMGSNVSRNSGKGLTGRRSQSSGNLYSDKREHQQNGTNSNGILPNKASTLLPGQGANYNVSHANNITNSQNVSETCPGTLIMSPLCAVSKKDRNKFCGSLPNHLDTDDIEKDSSISDNYCTFPVQITKGPRGLGLSISGGIDSNGPFPGLIRIKRLFPHQAAWSTGQLQPGDIILEVNGISLTGLTNYEALEVLRTMPNDVVLLICRPNDEQYQKLSPPTEPPKPPQRTQQQGTQTTLDDEIYPLQPLTPLQTNFTGEFEIIMVKQQGSLGFTLRKEDESVLGHYVRALVREPATTDGRIKPGDKIVAVNDVPLSAMTHEQAVIFLRQAADTVKLRLYRDEAQTPVAAMSPTNSENKTICGTMKKTFLRPEAINLLSDLAYKKQTPSANSAESSIKSTNSSPRRLKRGNKTNNTEINSQSEQDTTDSKSSSNPQYIVSSQTTSVCSDSEQSVASQCSFIVQPAENADNELFKMLGEEDRPDRPSFLDLTGQSGSTPMVPRKPRFQFSALQ